MIADKRSETSKDTGADAANFSEDTDINVGAESWARVMRAFGPLLVGRKDILDNKQLPNKHTPKKRRSK